MLERCNFFRLEVHNEVTFLLIFSPIYLSSRFCRLLSSGRIKRSLWYPPRKTWASGRCWETKHHLNYLPLKLHSWALFAHQPAWLELRLQTLLLGEQSVRAVGSVHIHVPVPMCVFCIWTRVCTLKPVSLTHQHVGYLVCLDGRQNHHPPPPPQTNPLHSVGR